ncbi:MAG TPA: formylglycine-generating enzyme family protein [Candidatus Bathyarchaeia archaeon]|nr:formylglycine-generating enzyme family protein [Candidatus Bathyarchaeia archaeon]
MRKNLNYGVFGETLAVRNELVLLLTVCVLALAGCPPPSPDETETIMLNGDVPLEMVWISGGTFMMGRYPGEQDSSFYEDPQHQVTVPGFWMAKYELTKRQWQAVMGTTPWSGLDFVLDDLDSPAVYVSWDDAKVFITALNTDTGLTFRLPSEAEWEYACRADTTTRFYWGDDPSYTQIGNYAWWWGNCSSEQYAHIVGQKLVNGFGLYDMSGNVYEGCEDDWHSSYTGAPTDGSAWVDTPRYPDRVFRGGGCHYGIYCRSAYRDYCSPDGTACVFGFRLSR